MNREALEYAHAVTLAWSAPILGAGLAGYVFAMVGAPVLLSLAVCAVIRITRRRNRR